MAFLLVIGFIITIIIIFPRIYKLIYKDELPYPSHVSTYVAIGIAFAIAGLSGLIKPETVSTVLLSLLFLLISAGFFVSAGLFIKGIAYIVYGDNLDGRGFRKGSRVVFRREHQRKIIRIFIAYCGLMLFLMLVTAILREKGL